MTSTDSTPTAPSSNDQTASFTKAGVIGWPIKHSRSPLIHGHWLNHHNINGSYEKIAVAPDDLPAFIQSLQKNGFAGVNVTVPHKEAVMDLADHITDEAATIGAANTLWFEDGKLIAGNTDSYGFITHLKTSAPGWEPAAPAMVLGAGGAARAIIHGLLSEGVPLLYLTNRTASRAAALAKEFGDRVHVIPWQEKHSSLADCATLVNSTSLGMTGNAPLEIDLSAMAAGGLCYDIVYAPLETPLLSAARQQGLTAVDGLGMLLHQAVPGFEKWFGPRPEVTAALTRLIIDDLQKDGS